MNAEISVVVPVFNSAATIADTLEHLLDQSLPPKEIIIVDDGSTDDTPKVINQVLQKNRFSAKPHEEHTEPKTARSFLRETPSDFVGEVCSEVKVLWKLNGGPASARNFGARLAAGSLIAFTDSDCLPDRKWLNSLIGGFDSPRIAGVGGTVKSVDGSLMGEYVDLLGVLEPAENAEGEIEYLITANACFRREALLRAGLFDERFRKPGGEEPALCRRLTELGYQFRSTPEAVVLHHHRQTVSSFLRTISNYGEGRYLLGQIWPDYEINHPARNLLRQMIAVRSLMRQFPVYAKEHGAKKALAFSCLDYLRRLAFLRGYLRGIRAAAANGRDSG